MKKIPPRIPRKHRSFKVDEEKETRCAHNARPSIPAGEAIIIPTIPTEIPFLIPEFLLNELLPSPDDTRTRAWFSTPISLFFRGFRLTHQPSPWIGDYAWCLITPITGKLQVPTSSVAKAVIQWRSSFPAPLPSYFFRNVTRFKASWFQVATGLSCAFEHQKS